MSATIYARLTDQGTAAAETATCALHIAQSPTTDDAAGELVDCTGNEALSCVICGAEPEAREAKQIAFDAAIDHYRDARSAMNTAATELIVAIAREFAPGATKAVLDDSDQEGSDFTFSHFEDADGNVVEPTDPDEVSNLIEAPASSLYPDEIAYEIEVTPTEREGQ